MGLKVNKQLILVFLFENYTVHYDKFGPYPCPSQAQPIPYPPELLWILTVVVPSQSLRRHAFASPGALVSPSPRCNNRKGRGEAELHGGGVDRQIRQGMRKWESWSAGSSR